MKRHIKHPTKTMAWRRRINYCLCALALVIFCRVPLARADEPPGLSLKEAIPAAEQAIQKENIDLNKYYIYSAEFSLSKKGSYWYINFQAKNTVTDNEIFVKVYMDKTTEITGIGFNPRKY